LQTIIIRSHERITYKRCETQWYWSWRLGLVPKHYTFKALTIGTWTHEGLRDWYLPGYERNNRWIPGYERNGNLAEIISNIADRDFAAQAESLTDLQVDQAVKAKILAVAMAQAYQAYYKDDPELDIIATEPPLEFSIQESSPFRIVHRLKPDAVFRVGPSAVMLLETKTAASVKVDHLVIDDQARPYGAMAEQALRNAGLIDKSDRLVGIRYNYMRKAFPDERLMNDKGESLNKDGSVSARQPTPMFKRYDVRLTDAAKCITLKRVRAESIQVAQATVAVRNKWKGLNELRKTPHWSCPRVCQYFEMCAAHENGADIIRGMQRDLYRQQDPYVYAEDTTDVPRSFEMG
jgi:hypothetical protein